MPSHGANLGRNSSPSTSPGGATDTRTNSGPDTIASAASQLLNQQCCSQLSSLPSDTAAFCLCEAIKVKALVNMKVNVPNILKACGKVSAVTCVN
uniref:Hydrophobic seed protein domain-containing protein n=1 Tax=Oryza meridionalis TaxID=40149 RepID=A0A0E0CY58_9ORYZ